MISWISVVPPKIDWTRLSRVAESSGLALPPVKAGR